MAWGNTVGVASWVEKLKRDDPSLTSVTVFRGRLFGPAEAAEVCEALKTNTHLTELYASGHKMDAATASLFADVLAVNTTLRSLCVGDTDFGDEGLAALTPGIAASTSLEAIDLENKGVGDEGAKALGAALGGGRGRSGGSGGGGCGALRSVNLARNDALGEAGVAAVCAGAARGETLNALTLAGLNLADGACQALGDLLASGCPLKTLDLTGATGALAGAGTGTGTGAARIGAGLAARGRDGRRLDTLVMDGVALGDAGAAALAGGGGGGGEGDGGEGSCPPVVALSLQGCGIGEEGGVAIAGVKPTTTVTVMEVLNLRDNKIGDAGAVALAAALCGGSTGGDDGGGGSVGGGVGDGGGLRGVKVLDVSSNGVGPSGAAELVRRAGPNLQNLSLFGNEAIGDAGAAAVLEAAGDGGGGGGNDGGVGGGASLKVLDIGGCGVEEAGLVRVCEALMQTKPSSDGNPGDGSQPGGGDGGGDDEHVLFTLFPALETLVVGGNPGVQGDAWEVTLGRLRGARPGLDVAWRAADAGDDQQSQQQGQQLLEQYKQQQGELPAAP